MQVILLKRAFGTMEVTQEVAQEEVTQEVLAKEIAAISI